MSYLVREKMQRSTLDRGWFDVVNAKNGAIIGQAKGKSQAKMAKRFEAEDAATQTI